MSSLSVHLRLPEDHSGLPFHPSCPVCRRDRLAGSLEGDEIVSRRTQAALAVGLLAFSGIGAPAAAVAAGPDQDVDGSAEVVESPDPGEADLDETTTGWTDGGAAPPEDESPAPVPEAEDGSMEAASREAVEEPVIEAASDEPTAEAEPAPEPVAVAAPPAEDPTATTEVSEPAASNSVRVDTAERAKREQPVKRAKREQPVKRRKPVLQPRVVAAPARVVAPATTNTVTVHVAAGVNQNTAGRASSGARFHVVRRGESLWSIASDHVGDGASDARVAREVSRLWELNEDAIASGNPDLLFAGTRLRLR